MNTIQIRCKGTKEVDISAMQKFQGKLKFIPEENLKKLKSSILKNGFRIPIFMWNEKVLDGHTRIKALEDFREDGYQIPKIPVVELQAESEQDAKKLLLLINSRYGLISEEGFYDFASDFDLSDLKVDINIPELLLDKVIEAEEKERKVDARNRIKIALKRIDDYKKWWETPDSLTPLEIKLDVINNFIKDFEKILKGEI